MLINFANICVSEIIFSDILFISVYKYTLMNNQTISKKKYKQY